MGCGMKTDLVTFAASHGKASTAKVTRKEQKELGQFLTPVGIARHMAKRCASGIDADSVRVLEPAAGAGILAAAVVEELLDRSEPPSSIHVTLFELDHRLVPPLHALARKMREAGNDRGVSVSVSVKNEDFLLSTIAVQQQPVADLIIANPPYFKIRAGDSRAKAHPYAVYGQPNIYGLFMAACAALTAPGGRWCFITPRSWTNGAYFAAVRRHLLAKLAIDAIHIFDSREAHFHDDEVLQEAMITWASPHAQQAAQVILSASNGVGDIGDSKLCSLPISSVIGADEQRMITLPLDGGAQADPMEQWASTLGTYGLKVSTGPVVAFRAERHIRVKNGAETVPLLWMQHVQTMAVKWPLQKKREYINASSSSAWMLVRNEPMVLMRRFSPKEDQRRITAAPYLGSLPGKVLGLENHLNYIYRPGGTLSKDEAKGLAAYLSSSLVDRHIRSVSGSTQVNAAELRKLPLPAQDILIEIGKKCREGMTLDETDEIVAARLGYVSFDRLEGVKA